jgi:hypothetical protein
VTAPRYDPGEMAAVIQAMREGAAALRAGLVALNLTLVALQDVLDPPRAETSEEPVEATPGEHIKATPTGQGQYLDGVDYVKAYLRERVAAGDGRAAVSVAEMAEALPVRSRAWHSNLMHAAATDTVALEVTVAATNKLGTYLVTP